MKILLLSWDYFIFILIQSAYKHEQYLIRETGRLFVTKQ